MIVLVGGQVGCDADAGSHQSTDRRPPAGTGVGGAEPPGPASQADAVPGELQGTWSLDVYCAALGGSLEESRFGRIAERPARSGRRHPGPTTMTLALYPTYFEMSWPRPDGTWQVGWSGAAMLRRGSLYLDYRYPDGSRDSFSWSARGRRLSLDYPATGVAEASPVSSFSLPSAAVDCPPDRAVAVR